MSNLVSSNSFLLVVSRLDFLVHLNKSESGSSNDGGKDAVTSISFSFSFSYSTLLTSCLTVFFTYLAMRDFSLSLFVNPPAVLDITSGYPTTWTVMSLTILNTVPWIPWPPISVATATETIVPTALSPFRSAHNRKVDIIRTSINVIVFVTGTTIIVSNSLRCNIIFTYSSSSIGGYSGSSGRFLFPSSPVLLSSSCSVPAWLASSSQKVSLLSSLDAHFVRCILPSLTDPLPVVTPWSTSALLVWYKEWGPCPVQSARNCCILWINPFWTSHISFRRHTFISRGQLKYS